MGERFIYYWLEQPTNQEIMDKQAEHNLSAKEITIRLQDYYQSYFEEVRDFADEAKIELKMSDEQKRRVQDAAIFCVNGKAPIHTDFKSGKPDAIPNISGVGRDSKIFDTLLHTFQIMNCFEHTDKDLCVEDWMIDVVEKCAYSSVNRERRKILEILVERNGAMTATQIGASEGLGLEKTSVEIYLHPLHAVGMIKKKTNGNSHTWFIDDPAVISFVRRVAPAVTDPTHVESIELDPLDEEKDSEYIPPHAEEAL